MKNDNKITCPKCKGYKETHDEHKNEYWPCGECAGTGYISKELSKWHKKFEDYEYKVTYEIKRQLIEKWLKKNPKPK